MYIITFTDIIDINHKLEEQQLPFKLHLNDTCGRQSVRVETIVDNTEHEKVEEAKDIIYKFFENRGSSVHFFEKNLEFRLDF